MGFQKLQINFYLKSGGKVRVFSELIISVKDNISVFFSPSRRTVTV